MQTIEREETQTYQKSDGYFKINFLCCIFDDTKHSVNAKLISINCVLY